MRGSELASIHNNMELEFILSLQKVVLPIYKHELIMEINTFHFYGWRYKIFYYVSWTFDIFFKNYDFENELWIGLRKVRERGIER